MAPISADSWESSRGVLTCYVLPGDPASSRKPAESRVPAALLFIVTGEMQVRNRDDSARATLAGMNEAFIAFMHDIKTTCTTRVLSVIGLELV